MEWGKFGTALRWIEKLKNGNELKVREEIQSRRESLKTGLEQNALRLEDGFALGKDAETRAGDIMIEDRSVSLFPLGGEKGMDDMRCWVCSHSL